MGSRFASPLRWPLALVVVASLTTLAGAEVEKTVHNLAAPGLTKEGGTVNPCYFCHTPHSATAPRALWNRSVPGVTYKLYESSTLKARLNQPTGASRLCLSCHDGTIALDERPEKARSKQVGVLRGRASLGTNLSDDHPISFTYDSALSTTRGELADPAILPSSTKLDETNQLQCTSCHDPHQDRYQKFLVMDNRFSQLCRTCHQLRGWSSSVHATSTATWKGVVLNPGARAGYTTVAENGCANCHQVHAAGRPEALLNFDKESKNCFACHSSGSGSKDVGREFRKFSAHPVEQSESIHTPNEDLRSMSRHVACSDCHNSHATQAGITGRSAIAGALQGIRGINSSGSRVAHASIEYEVCYSCHGLSDQPRSAMVRKDPVTNTRLEFDLSNLSFHPVEGPGKKRDILGLEPGYTSSSVIACSACHNSDTPNISKGPHGSTYEPILEREYAVQDPSPESYKAYSLCYKCHNRAALLSPQSAFPHKLHVVDKEAPCAACHDAHGSRSSRHLINFMTRGKNGNMVVSPSSSGRLEFQDLGNSQGRCYLRCHGSDHDSKGYPAGAQLFLRR